MHFWFMIILTFFQDENGLTLVYKLPEPVPFKVEAGHARADLRIPKSIPQPDEPLDIHAVSTGLVVQAISIRFIKDFFFDICI